jgi:hypothetical protein
MHATSRRVPLSYLFAALLVVAGLAMSAPPSCVCAPDEHFGLLLHPLFPHLHGDAHGAAAERTEPSDSGQGALGVEQAPGISSGTADSTGHDVLSGIILPLVLAAVLLEASRRLIVADARTEQRTLAPPSPPPRLSPGLA